MICFKDNLKKLILLKFPISPSEELYFGSRETGERKCLIVLTNVTKNVVAFKVSVLCVAWFTKCVTFSCFVSGGRILLNPFSRQNLLLCCDV